MYRPANSRTRAVDADAPYPNMVGVTRRFVVGAAEVSATSPPAPREPLEPSSGRASVYLAWSGVSTGDVQYHVYRQTDQGTVRLAST
jgi:hypothetical protein